MKSFYLVLCCCLMFAAAMIFGLGMHSCKSKKLVESSSQMDSQVMTACKEELDSLAFLRLLERSRKNWTLEVRHYRPVHDSTGKLTNTYMEKRVQMRYRHEKERDSSAFGDKQYMKGDSTVTTVNEETELKKEPSPKDYRIFFYLVLAYLLYLWMKK